MNYKLSNRNKSIAEQVGVMKSRYPHFTTTYTTHFSMKVTGIIRPTHRSKTYQFVLKYNINENPKTYIITPELIKNLRNEDIPHLYPDGSLCLYQPKYYEFRKTDFLCDTIIPWTSLWLYYYEIWHMTGEWLGGGEHPVKIKPKTNEKKE